jgi:hypothetical protein
MKFLSKLWKFLAAPMCEYFSLPAEEDFVDLELDFDPPAVGPNLANIRKCVTALRNAKIKQFDSRRPLDAARMKHGKIVALTSLGVIVRALGKDDTRLGIDLLGGVRILEVRRNHEEISVINVLNSILGLDDIFHDLQLKDSRGRIINLVHSRASFKTVADGLERMYLK